MENSKKTFTTGVLIKLFIVVFVLPFLPLFISRRWTWYEAWVLGIIWSLSFVVSRVLASWKHPDIIAERAQFNEHENTQSWDKYLAPIVAFGSILVPIFAGFEALFDGSTKFSLPIKIICFILFLAGYALATYALIENRFFSGTVRLQSERGHQIVSSGPYRWIRHPGYAGTLPFLFAIPIFLDSYWAFLPAVLICITLFIRTYKEDCFLQKNLPGYMEYTKKVKYRLIPGIW